MEMMGRTSAPFPGWLEKEYGSECERRGRLRQVLSGGSGSVYLAVGRRSLESREGRKSDKEVTYPYGN